MVATIDADLETEAPATDEVVEVIEADPAPEEFTAEETEIVSLRPVLATALSTSAAALVLGGIFDSWPARLFGLAVGLVGTALATWALRSKRPALAQLAVPPAIAAIAFFSVIPGGSPGDMQRLVRDAVDAARLLQIPIPFDPGWRPMLTVILGLLGFGSAWVAAGMKRPLLGVVLPVPLVALAAISQPTSQQVLAGIFAFLPILGAFGVLFGGGGSDVRNLGRGFEVSRLLRGAAGMAALAVALVVLGHTSFLFPKPVFDPNNRPQKPKSVPISQQRDRVLFTVQAPPGFTGPWRTNVLQVYEGGTWKLPGTGPGRLVDLPATGILATDSAQPPGLEVTLTTADLGPTAALPTVPTAQKVMFPAGHPALRLDTISGTMRVPAGRAPSGLTYKLSLPRYPTANELGMVQKITPDPVLLAVPPAPPAIQQLLAQAPPGPWDRLDFLRHQLLDHVTASGGGAPQDLTAARVVDLLRGSKKGTPFEIVAAQALLARWAGIPSRIGLGFNDVNNENGVLTVRPQNAAQWLEVRIDGYGWVPLLDVPPLAQADLENKDKNNSRILPSTDIAVQIYVPVELANPKLLFEQVRSVLIRVLPVLAVLLAIFLAAPASARSIRRRRRELWAEALGPRARIAVAYAEMRDGATDLSLGDPFATPIEYLDRVQEDGEHRELAWLVTRAMYGDLALDATDDDATAAEQMASSLLRRLRQAQPMQVRVIAALSRASILSPFSGEVPNVQIPRPLRTAREMVGDLMRLPARVIRGRARPRLPRSEGQEAGA